MGCVVSLFGWAGVGLHYLKEVGTKCFTTFSQRLSSLTTKQSPWWQERNQGARQPLFNLFSNIINPQIANRAVGECLNQRSRKSAQFSELWTYTRLKWSHNSFIGISSFFIAITSIIYYSAFCGSKEMEIIWAGWCAVHCGVQPTCIKREHSWCAVHCGIQRKLAYRRFQASNPCQNLQEAIIVHIPWVKWCQMIKQGVLSLSCRCLGRHVWYHFRFQPPVCIFQLKLQQAPNSRDMQIKEYQRYWLSFDNHILHLQGTHL